MVEPTNVLGLPGDPQVIVIDPPSQDISQWVIWMQTPPPAHIDYWILVIEGQVLRFEEEPDWVIVHGGLTDDGQLFWHHTMPVAEFYRRDCDPPDQSMIRMILFIGYDRRALEASEDDGYPRYGVWIDRIEMKGAGGGAPTG